MRCERRRLDFKFSRRGIGPRTREQILARYGNVFEEKNFSRRSGHILSVDVILWLQKEGLGFVEKPGQGITHRIVVPPGSELPR